MIIRMSNELGNQMFMYSFAFSMSKKLNRILLIDNETAFMSSKNISKYGLNNFDLSADIAPNNLKFKFLSGYLKRKFLIKTDKFRIKKNFFIEKKDKNKITKYDNSLINVKFKDDIFIEGHFESEKYFIDFKKEIKDQFKFKDLELLKKNNFYKFLNKENSVAICLRQNRFIEGNNQNNIENKKKSDQFSIEQIDYINKAVLYLKDKLPKPIFFLWSNDFSNIPYDKFNFKFQKIELKNDTLKIDKRIENLFLLSNCKHFIVIPSTFNWWGAWLSENKDKIILRPSNKFFSKFYINNLDFWPDEWIKISR